MGGDETSDANIIEIQEGPPNLEDHCQCGSIQCHHLVLSQELDSILSPKVIFRFPNQLDRIWPLLINGQTSCLASFLALLAEYKIETQCGSAWPPSYVAYRCRTCSKVPSMSLCADCFRNGDHEGHDYNMFKSISGGACDCGSNIMKENSNCNRHGRNAVAKRSQEQVPESIICVPRRSMPRLIHRLAIQLRRSHVDFGGEIDVYLECLSQIAKSSEILRGLMIDALVSEDIYYNQIQLLLNNPDKDVTRTISEGLKKLKRERKGLNTFRPPEEWGRKDVKAFCDNLVPTCFIEELIFWVVVFEFPQKLVCFLLGFLTDNRFKQVFAKAFVNHYPRIVMVLAGARTESRLSRPLRDSYEQLSSRILQVSVQIYNDEDLVKLLCEEENTLHILIYCLRAVIEGAPSDGLRGVLKLNPLCSNSSSIPKVVCCDNPIIRDRHLGSFNADLHAVLDCKHATISLLSDRALLKTWLETMSFFQSICPYKRELNEHTPYETGPHISVFSIESEFCLLPIWSILNHLKDEPSIPLAESLLQVVHENLSIWFHRMNITPVSLLDPYYMSFHIPVHRVFAATLRHMIYAQSRSDQKVYEFLSNNQSIFGTKYGYKSAIDKAVDITLVDFFKLLLLHPLQALTIYHETRSNMWTRNGIMTINQAVNYVFCASCYSTIDLDMFLLRYCAFKLNPNYFLKILMSRFHAWKWLSFKSNTLLSIGSSETRQLYQFNIQPEQITQMVESSLVIIIQLLTLSLHCNISDKDQTRQEMIALISVLDRSYSYLIEALPDKNVTDFEKSNENFNSLLNELTIYKPAQHGNGGNLQQGCYTLKPQVWDEEYNPMQVQFRCYQKRDYQMSLERFFQHTKINGKLERKYHPSTLWPPLKIPQNIGNFGQLDLSPMVECPTLVGIVFSMLYKNIYVVDLPDTIMAYAIHILELSLRKCFEPPKRPNPSFNGKFIYSELSSCPTYFGASDSGAYIKGGPIHSTSDKHVDQDDPRLFPVVRHALDLAFDSTWFPYSSVVDNCLVHLENVYSLPVKEFEAMLRSDNKSNLDRQQASGSKSSSTSAGEAAMFCRSVKVEGRNIDDEDDEEEDEEDEDEDDDEDDDDDDEDEDDDDEDDDDEGNTNNQVARITTAFSREQSVLSPDTDSDSELTELVRQRFLPGYVPRSEISLNDENRWRATSLGRRTQDRATNTQNYWTSNQTEEHNQSSGVATTTSQNLTRTTNTNTTTQSGLASQRLRSVFVRNPQAAWQSALESAEFISASELHERRERETSRTNQSSITTVVNNNDQATQEQHQQQQQQPLLTSDPHLNETMNIELIDDVAMITVSWPRSETDEQQTQQNNDNVESIAETNSQTNEVASSANSTQQQEQQQSNSPPTSLARSSSSRSAGDHTYSAMEIETLPESQSSALSLVPFQQPQIYAENLVTERRAILASDPRPMIASSNQRLAIEPASAAAASLADSSTDRVVQQQQQQQEDQSLSADEIQARFMNFFQSRLDSRNGPNRGGFRQRQMARRGGYQRGPIPPFAVHNPNNTRNSAGSQHQQAASEHHNHHHHTADGYLRPRQTARRSNACTLLNRVMQSRSSSLQQQQLRQRQERDQEHQQQGSRRLRLRKDRMHQGESVLSLLLRLHAKYSQRARSYEYNEQRAQANSSAKRSRIGDGVHFVTIVLDLICNLDQRMRRKLEQLQDLIWIQHEKKASDKEEQQQAHCSSSVKDHFEGMKTNSSSTASSIRGLHLNPATAAADPSGSKAALTASERRQRAKEYQSKLMAEFANKQRAFMDKYESGSSSEKKKKEQQEEQCNRKTGGLDKIGNSQDEERPINLSSKLSQSELNEEADLCDKRQEEKQQDNKEPQLTQVAVDKSLGRELVSGQQSFELAGQATTSSGLSYECCICGLEGPSDVENPLGQVVLLQSSSIFGHSHLRAKSERRLPCEESESARLKEETYAKYLERRIDLLSEHFSESSWLDSINIGAEGGVHVQSCGHYLHIECHQSYIKSLDQEDRLRSRSDSDEFLCPVCRQLANSVLPILSGQVHKLRQLKQQQQQQQQQPADEDHLDHQIKLIASLLERRLQPNQRELQSSSSFCSHLTKATGPQYRLVRSNASMHSLFLFLTSIARTNLESELIVGSCNANAKTSSTTSRNTKRSCFNLLFHVLALNAQTLINDQWFTCDQIWSHLTHCIDDRNGLSVSPMNSEVPLLLRDPIAMLLQFLFALSGALNSRANFTCLVQILFNLTAIQSTALVLSYAKPPNNNNRQKQQQQQQQQQQATTAKAAQFNDLLLCVQQNLSPILEPANEEPLMNSTVRNCWPIVHQAPPHSDGFNTELSVVNIENRIKLACLPFMRAAAFLQHHLFEHPFPALELDDHFSQSSIEIDFASLASCLSLVTNHNYENQTEVRFKDTLIWPACSSEQKMIESWSANLLRFHQEFSIAARTLLICRSLAWYRPSLMQLPRSFHDIFIFYYRKKCSLCHQVPKDVAVCLVCGAPICFRVSCCKDRSRSRQAHSQHCGANTAVFLAVHTSSIVIIRGNRACVWGSVYLDKHDEEDSGLQRGKPLYLVEARFELLEKQWITHSFDHTCGRRWIYLQDNQL